MSKRLLPLLASLLLFLLAVGAILTAFQVITTPAQLHVASSGVATGADLQADRIPAPQYTARPPQSESYYAAITDRPLFAPFRRPIKPEAQEPKPESTRAPEPEPTPEPEPVHIAPPPQPRLLGVMQAGFEAKALLSDPSGEMSWVTSGTTFSGWKINKITSEWIEIRHHEQTLRVELYRQ